PTTTTEDPTTTTEDPTTTTEDPTTTTEDPTTTTEDPTTSTEDPSTTTSVTVTTKCLVTKTAKKCRSKKTPSVTYDSPELESVDSLFGKRASKDELSFAFKRNLKAKRSESEVTSDAKSNRLTALAALIFAVRLLLV
ncbi:hypothetical protein BC833DRAFT_660509, partial [Globomyces pollinis-pini]